MKKLHLKQFIKEEILNVLKESVNEEQQTFDGLKQLARKVKGYKDHGKFGFSIPYEHGDVEIEPHSKPENITITWQSPGNTDDQVSKLEVGYSIVNRALKGSVNESIKVGDKFTTIDYGKTYNWWVTKEDDGLIELDNNNPRWSKFALATKEFERLVKSDQFTPVKESVNETPDNIEWLVTVKKTGKDLPTYLGPYKTKKEAIKVSDKAEKQKGVEKAIVHFTK